MGSEAPSGHTGSSLDTGTGIRGAKWSYWVELRQGMGSEAPSGHAGSR